VARLGFVHLSSERLVEPVRQGSSFAEKQASHPTRLLVVEAVAQRRGQWLGR
jgi:hypothetical protein